MKIFTLFALVVFSSPVLASIDGGTGCGGSGLCYLGDVSGGRSIYSMGGAFFLRSYDDGGESVWILSDVVGGGGTEFDDDPEPYRQNDREEGEALRVADIVGGGGTEFDRRR